MEKPKFKIVASDLDGTLLNSHKQITPRTKSAISALKKQDIHFVPITGRVLSSIPFDVRALKEVEYIVTSNGASTFHVPQNKEILAYHLPEDVIEDVLPLVSREGVIIEAFTRGMAYCENQILENLTQYGITGQHAKYMTETRTPVHNMASFLGHNKREMENINLLIMDDYLRKELYTLLKGKNFASVTSSSPLNIEITSKSATKAQALKSLCQTLGIASKEVLCLGDSENDMDMLAAFPYAVAMANSSDSVKACCAYTTDSNDNDGVAKAIEKFVLTS